MTSHKPEVPPKKYRNPSGRYFHGIMEPVWMPFFDRKATVHRTPFGYFINMKHKAEHGQVAMRLPGCRMLTKAKFEKRLLRAQAMALEITEPYSDDEFIELPKKKRIKKSDGTPASDPVAAVAKCDLAHIASALACGQIITRARSRSTGSSACVALP